MHEQASRLALCSCMSIFVITMAGCDPRGGRNYAPMGDEEMGLILTGNLGTSAVLAPDPSSQTDAFGNAIVPYQKGQVSFQTLVNVNVLDPANPDQESSAVLACSLSVPPLIVDPTSNLNNTLKFSVPNPPSAPNGYLTRPSALVEWGSGGVVSAAEVDFADGFSFSVPASWLRVTARNDYIPALRGLNPTNLQFGRAVTVGAQCGIGSISKSNTFNAKRTIYEDNFNNASVFYRIPQFATNMLVYYVPNDNLSDTITVHIRDESGARIMEAQFNNIATQDVPVELPADARYFDIPTHTNTFAGSVIRFIFGLAL